MRELKKGIRGWGIGVSSSIAAEVQIRTWRPKNIAIFDTNRVPDRQSLIPNL